MTQLYVTDAAASEHRARVAGCDRARTPPNAGCSESPMGLEEVTVGHRSSCQRTSGTYSVKKSELKITLPIDEMIFALGEGK